MAFAPRRFWQGGRVLRWRRAPVIIVAALAAWPLIAYVAARALVVNTDLPRADALVVMSGSTVYAERARHAARLFHEGRAPKVILTNDGVRGGWSQEEGRNVSFNERAVAELRRAGVPAASIEVLPGFVSSTYDEARLLHARAGETQRLGSLLIVTSGYHSRRALGTFRGVFAGSDVQLGMSAVAPGGGTPSPATWWMSRRGWPLVAGEYLKLIYYRLKYR